MLILGIETSCDETAAAVVTDKREIRSHLVLSQLTQHAPYGGVVPEIAARAHIDCLDDLIRGALEQAGITPAELDAVAVTAGPGLIGGVIVGLMTAKALAASTGKPLIAVNHLEGHALTVRLVEEVDFPYLLLLVSGGHCQYLSVTGVGKYEKLGGTIDDALGEAFDKTAKMLGLGYPGGPMVEKLALTGKPTRFTFPEPLKDRQGCDFSFSGLKTAIRLQILELQKTAPLSDQDKADICASFQYTVGRIVHDRTERAIAIFKEKYPEAKTLVVAGGVAANLYLRQILEAVASKASLRLIAPPIALCTDNAAMIAWVGVERMQMGLTDGLDFEPRARWPLAEL